MLRHWQLSAAACWGVLAVGLLFRRFLFDEEALARVPGNLGMANLICGFLCVWNLARWYQSQAARRHVVDPNDQPLQPNRAAGSRYEYNPEFDFQKPDDKGG